VTVQVQNPLVSYYAERTSDIVALTTTLANFETPTGSKPDVDKMGVCIEGVLKDLGAQVQRIPRETVGDILLAKWNADRPGKPILFMMHMDTVWPLGTLAQRPVHVEGDRLIGPGVWDMKGSIALVLSALKGMRDRKEFPDRPVWALFTSDEETGSAASQAIIEETAKQVGLALVMEFAATNGGIKTWRKGISHYTVNVTGKSSHAGNAPEKGINAVVELAHQTLRISEFQQMDKGTSVSVTVVKGGTAFNVIPAAASAEVDVRFLAKAESERIEKAMNSLQPKLPGAGLQVVNNTTRPPMERDATMERSYGQIKAIAAKLGIDLPEEGSGGGSDGNFTSAIGVPTLDGLGAWGEGAHAAHEQLVISSLAGRAAILDALVREWKFEA